MRKNFKKFISFIIIIAVFAGIMHTQNFTLRAFAAETRTGYDCVAESENIALYVSADNMAVSVLDKRTGYFWDSSVDFERLERRPNELWRGNSTSLVLLDYAVKDNKNGDVQTTNMYKQPVTVKRENLTNGVSLMISFETLEIYFELRFKLDGDMLTVTIPEETLKDNTKHVVMSIKLLPFFGYSVDSDKGFYLYPNGSGEIYEFKEELLRQNSLMEYWIQCYYPQVINMNMQEFGDEKFASDVIAMIPAYGVRIGGGGFVSIIEGGDANAIINIAPSGVAIKANRIHNNFIYRNSYGIFGSDIAIGGGTQKYPLAVLSDKERIPGDRSVSYTFLYGESANYSGMANAARERLITTKRLVKSEKVNAYAPVYMDIFSGITERKLIFDSFIKMTTFTQTEEIVKTLSESFDSDLIINLKGWSKKGFLAAPINYPASFWLGGKSGLKNLAATCAKYNTLLYLQANFTDLYSKFGGFSRGNDVAKDPNQVAYARWNESHFMLSPFVAKNWNGKLLNYISDIGISGITYERMGKILFNDYNTRHTTLRVDAMDIYSGILGETSKSEGGAAAEGGNLYVLNNSDIVKSIPDASNYMSLGDKSVPFYQMIVHGSVLYTGTPMNLFYDAKYQKLKMLEMGYAPIFEITWDTPHKLRNTPYNTLFTSEFSHWKDEIIYIANEFKETTGGLWDEYIINHEQIAQEIYCTTYSGGTKIYVNYSPSDYIGDGFRVPAESYYADKREAGL